MIRPATPDDVSAIADLIYELAAFENLTDQVTVAPERLAADLFAEPARCGAFVAEIDGVVVGYAIYFASYSTFKFRQCLWLEDLYVTPDHRGGGTGKALFVAVAAEAKARECPRLDWCVLDWNRGAIDFYEALGAQILPDWRVCRLEGAALTSVAAIGC